MRRRISAIGLIFIVIILIILALLYFRGHKDDHILTLYGNVDVRQVEIAFRVAGQVEELCCEEGEQVKKGKLMARLNETPFISQLKESKERAASIEANVKNSEILLRRRQELVKNGNVSQEDLDNATAKHASLLADLASARASLGVSEDNLSYTKVYAPTEGVILTRVREPGTVVNPANPVYTLSVAKPVWVRAYVSEPNLGAIFFGMEAEIFTDTRDVPPYHGKIGFISPVAEFTPKTVQTTDLRTDLVYRLRIYVDDPDQLLKQGMPVTVKLDTSRVREKEE